MTADLPDNAPKLLNAPRERVALGALKDPAFMDMKLWDSQSRDRPAASSHDSPGEQFAQTVLDGLSSAIAILDGEGAIMAVNQAWRQFALENPPVNQNVDIGANYLRVCDGATGADSEEARLAAEGIRAVAAGERRLFTLEYPCHSPQTQRWFLMRVTPFRGEGAARVVVAHENITERKEAEKALAASEERLSLILSNVEDAVFLLSVAPGEMTRFAYVNPSFLEWAGLRENQVVGKRVREVLPEAAYARVAGGCAEAIHGRHAVGWREVATDPSGERVGDVRLSPFFDEAGRCSYLIGAIHDITERMRIEQEREQHLLEARERADRDPLTGLLNHRAFQHRLASEAARARRENSTLAIVMMDLDNFKFFNDAYGHATGDDVLRLVAEKLQTVCRPYDTQARFGGDEFAMLLPSVGRATVAEIEARLRADLTGVSCLPETGAMPIPITLSLGAALFTSHDSDYHETLRQADERLLWSKTGGDDEENARRVRADAGVRVQGFSMLDALVTAVDNKDRYTRRHSEDVMTYSQMIARELSMSEGEQRTVAIAALLHDVGKIGVPDAILRKPGKLTDVEFEAVKQHPQMGAIIVQAVPGLEDTLDAVRHHHERWDGGGYPFGLRGEEIPLIARLMAVADAYSAMTTDRPYRKGMGPGTAMEILENGAGTQWDPRCVGAFVRGRRVKVEH